MSFCYSRFRFDSGKNIGKNKERASRGEVFSFDFSRLFAFERTEIIIGGTMLKKRFSFLRLGWVPLFMGILLIGALVAPTAQAQVTVKYDTTYVPLNHTMTANGDSAKYLIKTLKFIETGPGALLTGDPNKDSLEIKAPAGWQFVKDSVVTITASQTRTTGVKFDTTGLATTNAPTVKNVSNLQAGSVPSMVKVKAVTTGYFTVRIGTASTVAADTIVVTGLYLQSTTTVAMYDSSTVARATVDTVGGTNISASYLVALPGPLYAMVIGNAPNASQTAGKYISSVATGSAAVDTTNGVKIYFQDQAGNWTPYNSTVPSVSVLLDGTTTPGNGTLSGASTVVWYDHKIAVDYGSMRYTKAEAVDLKFAVGSVNVTTSGTTTFGPGSAANISLALNSGYSDTFTVDQTTQYTLTVTDAYFNPVPSQGVSGAENTPHGGTFATIPNTDTAGHTTAAFTPSKFFVGADTLKFTAGLATQLRAILINPGALGGLIVDYAPSASSSTALSENIASGVQVYVRAFLRDTYGNPINTTDTSAVQFTASAFAKNASLAQSGKVATAAVTESQYPNSSKTATGIAIPYTVSTKTPYTDSVLVLTSTGGYKNYVTITNRSNVPVTLKMYQSTGTDSSVVASNYANSIAFSDSLWDAYGNLVADPGTSVTVAPTHGSYAMYFSTKGLAKFLRAADTTAADTLYPVGGVIARTVASGKVTGVDTVKTWSAASSSVAAATPVWVTPAAYAALVLTPVKDSTAVAGQQQTFTVEKQDAYGNHIDFGLAGGNARGNTGSTTKPTATQITDDSTALTADTVSTGHNRGGYVTKTYTITGTVGVASVGGSLDATFPFTAYTAGADTQKVYASLYSKNDTSLVISMPTGVLHGFLASIAAADSQHFAGDSVAVTFTAQDSALHRIYTYNASGQILTLNHTAVTPIATEDTTYYFTYVNSHGAYVKSTGASISDTVFNQGKATFYLHKFAVDSVNTVTITGGGFTATASQGVKFVPLAVDVAGAFGHWAISVADTLSPTGAFVFTVTPRDQYYNVNSKQQVIVNVSSNQTSGFNVGSNPKVIQGPTSFTGTLSGARGNLIIYVFNNTNANLLGQSAPVFVTGVEEGAGLPKTFALDQNYPNPFNPTTNIKFDLPKMTNVKIVIYDILGREVRTLVDGNMAAGRYTETWNGLNDHGQQVGTGVYFYRMEAGSFVSMKKMLLLK